MIPTVSTHPRPQPSSRIAQLLLQHRRSSIRACIIRRFHHLNRLTAHQRLRLLRASARYDRLRGSGHPTPPAPVAAIPLPVPTTIDLAA